jgi:ABC-type ATPase with predicted acetyltransferase domain
MQNYNVILESPVFASYRCKRAADSLDIDVEKKSVHKLSITADLKTPFNVGLILGASGSGKTTLAKQIYGTESFEIKLDLDKPIIEQLNPNYSYDECATILNGIGLSAVPCWIKPVKTLSNGQKARAEAAFLLSELSNKTKIIDEWTSVVDRTVAKAMSHCAQKMVRKTNKQVVFLSCHYDVVEWLNPDWIIDCNTESYLDRRSLHQHNTREQLSFQVRRCDRKSWRYFSKYHYLSENLPGGEIELFGLFEGDRQIGFQCFAKYKPKIHNEFPIFHSNRTVIHPDYVGFGLGLKLINESSRIFKKQKLCEIRAKFSSVPVFKAMMKDKINWRLLSVEKKLGVNSNKKTSKLGRSLETMRHDVTSYIFKYVGPF